jgi:hypothetical protein
MTLVYVCNYYAEYLVGHAFEWSDQVWFFLDGLNNVHISSGYGVRGSSSVKRPGVCVVVEMPRSFVADLSRFVKEERNAGESDLTI